MFLRAMHYQLKEQEEQNYFGYLVLGNIMVSATFKEISSINAFGHV
jgi:hypothetical protein